MFYSSFQGKACLRGLARAVGLMEIENIIRYASRAVGLKTLAMQGKARLRGLERNNDSKTIISVYAPRPSHLRVHWTGSRGGAEIGSAVLIRSVGRGCTRRRKRVPRDTAGPDYSRQNSSTSALIRPIRTESVFYSSFQGEAGASRATAGPDYSRQNSSTSALIRRIRADPCSIPASRAKPACAGWRVLSG